MTKLRFDSIKTYENKDKTRLIKIIIRVGIGGLKYF